MWLIQHQIDYQIPWETATWAERIERGCQALEALFPGEHLSIAQPWGESRDQIVLSDRPAYLRKKRRGRRRWLALYNGKYVRGYGGDYTDEGAISFGGDISRAAPDLYRCGTIFRQSPWALCENILVALGDALEAYTSYLSSPETFMTLRRVQWRHGPAEEIPPLDLPLLRDCSYGGLPHRAQPQILGWLNYWSAETCDYVGFPDPARDEALLAHSYRTPAGAWLVKLGADPLDLKRDEHVTLLREAYARFDKVGVRP